MLKVVPTLSGKTLLAWISSWIRYLLLLEQKEKKSVFNYGSNGYRFFHPFVLLDKNPASCDDYFHVVMEILATVDDTFNREEYVFFRGDVNIVMMWIRVSFVVIIGLFSLFH